MTDYKGEISRLLADETFINYCKKTSPEDVTYWQNYIHQYPEQREQIDLAKEAFRTLFNALADADRDEQVWRLKSRLNQKESAPVINIEDWKQERIKRKFSPGRI